MTKRSRDAAKLFARCTRFEVHIRFDGTRAPPGRRCPRNVGTAVILETQALHGQTANRLGVLVLREQRP